jgi:dTDP-4-amino-4,6-dideoxygalactose transaminase
VHGEGVDKYDAAHIGLAARLDTIQAAVLLEKLKIFPDEIAARNAAAERYAAGLAGVAIVPQVAKDQTSVWAQYTIRLPAGRRDALAAALKAQGIPTAVYYAKPLHRQAAYSGFPVADGGLAVSEKLAEEVISLPMHAYLDGNTQDRIVAAVRTALAA